MSRQDPKLDIGTLTWVAQEIERDAERHRRSGMLSPAFLAAMQEVAVTVGAAASRLSRGEPVRLLFSHGEETEETIMAANPYEHVGEHLQQACEDCFNFHQNWAATAAKVAALNGVVNRLRMTAGSLFSSSTSHEQEELAKFVRSLAEQFAEEYVLASRELDTFIHRREKATG